MTSCVRQLAGPDEIFVSFRLVCLLHVGQDCLFQSRLLEAGLSHVSHTVVPDSPVYSLSAGLSCGFCWTRAVENYCLLSSLWTVSPSFLAGHWTSAPSRPFLQVRSLPCLGVWNPEFFSACKAPSLSAAYESCLNLPQCAVYKGCMGTVDNTLFRFWFSPPLLKTSWSGLGGRRDCRNESQEAALRLHHEGVRAQSFLLLWAQDQACSIFLCVLICVQVALCRLLIAQLGFKFPPAVRTPSHVPRSSSYAALRPLALLGTPAKPVIKWQLRNEVRPKQFCNRRCGNLPFWLKLCLLSSFPVCVWSIPGGPANGALVTELSRHFSPDLGGASAAAPHPSAPGEFLDANGHGADSTGMDSDEDTALGVVVFAPHFHPVPVQILVREGASMHEVFREVQGIGLPLPLEHLDCMVPVSPLPDPNSGALVVFPHILDHSRHAAVVIDLSAVGGKVFATVLPSVMGFDVWARYISPMLEGCEHDVDVFLGSSDTPSSGNDPMYLQHGMLIAVRIAGAARPRQISLAELLESPQQWQTNTCAPAPEPTSVFCLLSGSKRWLLRRSDFPRTPLAEAAAACVALRPGEVTFAAANNPAMRNLCVHGTNCCGLALVTDVPPALPVPPARSHRPDYFVFLDFRCLGVRPYGMLQWTRWVHLPSVLQSHSISVPEGYDVEVAGGIRQGFYIEVAHNATLTFWVVPPPTEEGSIAESEAHHESSDDEAADSDADSPQPPADRPRNRNRGRGNERPRSRSPRRYGYAGCMAPLHSNNQDTPTVDWPTAFVDDALAVSSHVGQCDSLDVSATALQSVEGADAVFSFLCEALPETPPEGASPSTGQVTTISRGARIWVPDNGLGPQLNAILSCLLKEINTAWRTVRPRC